MIWNPHSAYLRIKDEITNQGLVKCLSSRTDLLDRLKVGHKGFDSHGVNPSYEYTVVHMPDTAKKSGDAIVFGIEYYNIPYGNISPFIVVQYEYREPLLIVYFDLHRDKVIEVAASQSAEEPIKALVSIKGKNLEESVQILFASIRKNRVA